MTEQTTQIKHPYELRRRSH